MTTVKEVELSKEGEMVTPVTIIDSVKMLDGSKLIDALNGLSRNILPSNWTKIEQNIFNGDNILNSICYGDGKLVAGGRNTIAYSLDGLTWINTNQTVFNQHAVISLCYGNGKFIACGSYIGTTSFSKMAYSNDGITWHEINLSIRDDKDVFNNVCYGNGVYVATSYNLSTDVSKIAYSLDGITWTNTNQTIFVANPSTIQIQGLCYGGGKFIAVNPSAVAYSLDGMTWTKVNQDIINGAVFSIAYGNERFVVTYGMPPKIAYSNDGITWYSVIQDVFTDSTLNSVFGLCYGNGKFIATSRDAVCGYSLNGAKWNKLEVNFPVSISECVYAKGKFICCDSYTGDLYYSQTGLPL